jgi:tetratricopeptide (TPR) repeat protein
VKQPENSVESASEVEDTDTKLLAQAEKLLKEKDYEDAYIIYKSVLGSQPDNQQAKQGIETILNFYLNTGDALKKNENYKDALTYYKKAAGIQPQNSMIKGLITECTDLIAENKPDLKSEEKPEIKPEVKPSPVEETKPTPPPGKESNTKVSASGFNSAGWIYPNIDKSECTVTGSEVAFNNTSSQKFVLFNKDLFNVNLSADVEIEGANSVIGLVIGYSSPLDYYVFKYRDGGNFTLQRISGNEIQKLFEIAPGNTGSGGLKKLRIIYTNNVVNVYSEHGLLKSYRSVWGIFGKAGLYIEKNSSAAFKNVNISGSTALE